MAAGAPPALVIPEAVDEAPPCELPAWCSEPAEGTQGADVEIWRVPATPLGLPEGYQPQATRLVLGRRAWILIGRPHLQGAKGGRQPDIELQTVRASRRHALLLRNFHAQIFVMDLGSTHGTFLGRQRLPPHTPREWKEGVTVHFADNSVETFENRPTRLVKARPPMPSQNWLEAAGSSKLQGIAALAAASAAAAAAKAAAEQQAASFAGTRMMMQAELGEQLKTQPLNQAKQIEDVAAAVPVDPLYPGEWQVPADGLSEMSLSGGALERAEQHDQQAAAVSVSVALKLEERLRKIKEEKEGIARELDKERQKEKKAKKEKAKKDKADVEEQEAKEKEKEREKREREKQKHRDREPESDSDKEEVAAIENGEVDSQAEQKGISGHSGLNISALNAAVGIAEDEMLLELIRRLFAEGSQAQIHELGIWVHSDLIKSRPHLLPKVIGYYAEAMHPTTASVDAAPAEPSDQEGGKSEESVHDEERSPSQSHRQKKRKRERTRSQHPQEEKLAKAEKRPAKSRSHSSQNHEDAPSKKKSRDDDKSRSTSRGHLNDKKREKTEKDSRKQVKEEKRRKADKVCDRSCSHSQERHQNQKSGKVDSKPAGSRSRSKTRAKHKKHKSRKRERGESCSDPPLPLEDGLVQEDEERWHAEEQSWRTRREPELAKQETVAKQEMVAKQETVAEPLEDRGRALAERMHELTSQGNWEKELENKKEWTRTSEKAPKETHAQAQRNDHKSEDEKKKKEEKCVTSDKETALTPPKPKARNAFDMAPAPSTENALMSETSGCERQRSQSLKSSSATLLKRKKKEKERKRSRRRGRHGRRSSPSSTSRHHGHGQRERSRGGRHGKHRGGRRESRGESDCKEARDEVLRKYAALSEDELMQLGPSRLVECFKLLVKKKRISNPNFQHARLRDAYADALRQLLQQPRCYDESSSHGD